MSVGVISMLLQGFFHLCSHETIDFCSTGKPLYYKILKSLVLCFEKKSLKSSDISMKKIKYDVLVCLIIFYSDPTVTLS